MGRKIKKRIKKKLIKGRFPKSLIPRRVGSGHEVTIWGIQKIMEKSGFEVYGPLHPSDYDYDDIYHVMNSKLGLSATLIVSTTSAATSIVVIGPAQNIVAQILKLKDAEETDCRCEAYWCIYR